MRERCFAQSRASIVGLRIIIFSVAVRITAFRRHGCGGLLSSPIAEFFIRPTLED